jgi:hypothetical protein
VIPAEIGRTWLDLGSPNDKKTRHTLTWASLTNGYEQALIDAGKRTGAQGSCRLIGHIVMVCRVREARDTISRPIDGPAS